MSQACKTRQVIVCCCSQFCSLPAQISQVVLARASQRTRELAIRTALAVSVLVIAAQLAAEVLLVAVAATLSVLSPVLFFGRFLPLSISHDLAAGFSVQKNPLLLFSAGGSGLLAAG
jgi:hypothetical protein